MSNSQEEENQYQRGFDLEKEMESSKVAEFMAETERRYRVAQAIVDRVKQDVEYDPLTMQITLADISVPGYNID